MTLRLHGLVAATHVPLNSAGELNLSIVEKLAEHLHRIGVRTVFVNGSTGESHSLSVEERLSLARRWSEVVRHTNQQLIIHVGANCLVDAKSLAAHAQSIGATAISALAPSYFKPKSVEILVEWCREIASAAPGLPFYYYDIPGMTGVSLPMVPFLHLGVERIPTLAGLKFSNPDLMTYQQCLHLHGDRFDVPWGIDEYLLSALSVGAIGGVGSSYNFAAPLYHRMIAAFAMGNLAQARAEQFRSVQLIEMLGRFGYMAAAKAVMGFLGVEVGPARLPHSNLTPDQRTQLRSMLVQWGFFDPAFFAME